MDNTRSNVLILSACQALLFINNSTVIAINALAGHQLAVAGGHSTGLATVPITAWVIGAATTALPAAQFMRRVGRKIGFTLGAGLGIVGALAAALAMYAQSFVLLCIGTFIFGAYNGFAQQYRFAAADASPADFKPQAISYVLAGGLVGGLVGPQLSTLTIDLFDTRYLGAYLVLVVFIVVAILLIQRLDIPPESREEAREASRPMSTVARQPAFIVAVTGAALSYAVMNLLMVATPLAMMDMAGHAYHSTANVIGWHVVAMFGPSFFTGTLIKRFGVLNVMLIGTVFQSATIGVALSGTGVTHFWWALVLLGVGWNFLYIGGTTLLTRTYRPAERAKAQGVNEVCIFLTMAITSFSSGMLFDGHGWALLNYVSGALVAVMIAAVLWLSAKERIAGTATAATDGEQAASPAASEQRS